MVYSWVVLGLIAALLCSPEPTAGQETAAKALTDIEKEFWEWRMAEAPMFSTAVGESRYNDALESFAPSVYTERETKVQEFKTRLQAVDRTQLNDNEKLDYDLFTHHLQIFLDGAQWNSYFTVNPINFLEGITSNPSRMTIGMPFNSSKDFENYRQRLSKLPQQINEQIDLLKTAVSTGKTLNNVSVAAVPAQIDKIVQVSPRDSPFYHPVFTTKLNDSQVPPEDRGNLQTMAEEAIIEINTALTHLKSYLENSYMPASRTSWGVNGWPDGEAIYRQCIRYHTSTDMTPQQVHDLGLQEVARIQTNMHDVLQRLQFSGTIKEFYDSVRADPRFHKNSSEALIETYRDYVFNHTMPKLSTIFEDVPDLPLKVEPMPNDGPGGLYQAGSPDGSIPGIFYANVINPQDTVTINMMSLVLHEAAPGHHLQASYSLTSSLPNYRAFPEDANYYRMPATFPIGTAYMEGWGLYSEYLGEEMGMYTDDYMLMGRYSDEIFRACRLVVDTGLHYFGWERERAIEYMLNNTAESRGSLTTEIDRYLTWPGQATAYKIGEIKIKQLREKASQALRDKFQLKKFHSVILKNGGMPLNLLERLVDDWIKEQQSGGPTGGSSVVSAGFIVAALCIFVSLNFF